MIDDLAGLLYPSRAALAPLVAAWSRPRATWVFQSWVGLPITWAIVRASRSVPSASHCRRATAISPRRQPLTRFLREPVRVTISRHWSVHSASNGQRSFVRGPWSSMPAWSSSLRCQRRQGPRRPPGRTVDLGFFWPYPCRPNVSGRRCHAPGKDAPAGNLPRRQGACPEAPGFATANR